MKHDSAVRRSASARDEATLLALPPIVRPVYEAICDQRSPEPAIDAAARGMGFVSFSFAVLRNDIELGMQDFFMLTTTPKEFIAECRREKVLTYDPRLRAARMSAVPVMWDRDRFPDDEQSRAFFDIAERYELYSGVFALIRQPDPSCTSWLSLSSNSRRAGYCDGRPIVDQMGEILALAYYSYHLMAGVLFATTSQEAAARKLSMRERQCLLHVAAGCTSRTTAAQLGISERTVNAHLEQAIRKLGASNRQQAVAKAIKLGVIKL